MRCKKCGEELPERARFCYVCGAPVEEIPSPKRLEDPLDPLAAGAVPLVPVARPPRAYMVGSRGVRSTVTHVDRRASLPVIRPQEPVMEKPEEFEEPLVEEVSDADSTASLAAAREAAAATSVEQGETAEKHEEPADDAAPVADAPAPAKDVPADEPEAAGEKPVDRAASAAKAAASGASELLKGAGSRLASAGRQLRDGGRSVADGFQGSRVPPAAVAGGAIAVALIVIMVLVGLGTSWLGPFAAPDEEPPVVQPPSDGSIAPLEAEDDEAEPDALPSNAPEVRNAVADYSWAELSQISALIADAASDEEGLEIAEQYNLCDADGTLDGTQTKSVTLSDGTTLEMRVAGFRADERADGEGVAGITFIAANPAVTRAMGSTEVLGNGWVDSELRAWMNGELAASLPEDLSGVVVEVSKRTNTPPDVGGSQQVTGDTLWIPAYSEVVGPLGEGAEFYNSYDSEGDQYQLFSDAGVSWGGDTSFLAVGANWWLRSPDRASSIRYLSVLDDGTLGWRFRPQADHAVLVSFCV